MILRKLKKQNLHSGESLPEVMVSGLLFLMMAAVLQGAVAFGNRAKTKSESIRKENAKICRMLRETPWTDSSETAAYTFVAISPDESQVGTTKLSQVEVRLGRKEVLSGTDTVSFYMFGPPDAGGMPETPGPGGEAP